MLRKSSHCLRSTTNQMHCFCRLLGSKIRLTGDTLTEYSRILKLCWFWLVFWLRSVTCNWHILNREKGNNLVAKTPFTWPQIWTWTKKELQLCSTVVLTGPSWNWSCGLLKAQYKHSIFIACSYCLSVKSKMRKNILNWTRVESQNITSNGWR